MNLKERIAGTRAALAAIEVSIAGVEAALRMASNLNDVARLNNQLVSLKAQRTQLQMELANLETSLASVGAAALPKLTPGNRKAARAISRDLQKTVGDRRLIDAALSHSSEVLGRVTQLRSILSGSNTTED